MTGDDWRLWTVWRFRSVDGKQVVVQAIPSEPFEPEHEYQKILGRFAACSRREAIDRATRESGAVDAQ